MTARNGKRTIVTDFRDFIMRGNVIDLAVAVIIGAAFGRIITSFVENIVTPLILNPAMQAAQVDKLENLSAGGIQYGLFLAAVLNFLVIAFCLFFVVRSFEGVKRRIIREEAIAAPEPTPDPAIVAQEKLTATLERLIEVMAEKS